MQSKYLVMNRKKYQRLLLVTIFLMTNHFLVAQYLRDSTRFIFSEKSYPQNDSDVFNHYPQQQVYSLTLHPVFGIPEIEVTFSDVQFPLFFDFGNSGNILITNAIEKKIDYFITDTTHTYTPDGKVRGQVYDIIIPNLAVFGKKYHNENATLSDWSIFSTEPINGIVGLNYLKKKCFTLSYKRKLLAIGEESVVKAAASTNSNIIPLETYSMQPTGIYFQGEVNNTPAVIYFDTGKNYSVINRKLVGENAIVSDKSGSFYNGTILVSFGDYTFKIRYPRVGDLNRSIDDERPIGIDVGSDLLQHFLITVDRAEGRNLLFLHH